MTAVMSAWWKSSATRPPRPAGGAERATSVGAWARGRPSVESGRVRPAASVACGGVMVGGGGAVLGGAASGGGTDRGGRTSGSVRDTGGDDRGLGPLVAQPASKARTTMLHGRMRMDHRGPDERLIGLPAALRRLRVAGEFQEWKARGADH